MKQVALLLAWALWAAAVAQAAPRVVAVPVQERGQQLELVAYWFVAPPGAQPAPAMVLLHGCSGAFGKRGELADRYRQMAEWLNTMQVHALVLDSLGARGERELCTQRTGTRRVTQAERRLDALAALAWVAAQPGVDTTRLGLLGWSNGGSTVLAATNRRHRAVQEATARPSLAVAFYPGCEAERQRGYEPTAPLLLLLGEADDWTPAAPCQTLAAPGGLVQWEAYPGAYHGFDGSAPVRLRTDVPNGVRPGAGVHVGANPAAREAARARLETFVRQTWGLAP